MIKIGKYVAENPCVGVRRGRFSTAYLYSNNVLIDTTDGIKECLANGWFPDHRNLPVGEFRNDLKSRKDDGFIIEMPRYHQPRGFKAVLSSEDWLLFKELTRLDSMRFTVPVKEMHRTFIKLVEDGCLSDDHKDMLCCTYEACMNYSSRV